jgi:hypothetical protein
MKITAITLTVLNLGALAYCRSQPSAVDHNIAVCFAGDNVSGLTLLRATTLASDMFGEIGVLISWRHSSLTCPEQAIVVRIRKSNPVTLHPGALAYALPYEGTHIDVFYDRIEDVSARGTMDVMLAHVLVHEITHILEGSDRHSKQGVMKAKWGSADFFHMRERPLGFAPEDVHLIYLGFDARRKRAMLAINTNQSRATTGRYPSSR